MVSCEYIIVSVCCPSHTGGAGGRNQHNTTTLYQILTSHYYTMIIDCVNNYEIYIKTVIHLVHVSSYVTIVTTIIDSRSTRCPLNTHCVVLVSHNSCSSQQHCSYSLVCVCDLSCLVDRVLTRTHPKAGVTHHVVTVMFYTLRGRAANRTPENITVHTVSSN